MRASDLFILLVLAGLWSLGFVFTRELAPAIGPMPTAAARVVLAGGFLACVILARRLPWRFEGKLAAALGIGVVNSGIPFAMYSFAAQYLPAGYSVILNATTPLMGVILGAAFFHERLTVYKIAGAVCGIAGVAILTGAGPVAVNLQVLLGCAACLVAAACYGLAAFLTRRWIYQRGELDNLLLALASQAGAVVLLVPLAAGTGLAQPASGLAVGSLAVPILALGLLCTGLAYLLYFRLLARIGPQRVLTVTFIMPPFGVLWGAVLLDEALSWAHLWGGLAILLAVYLGLKASPDPGARDRTADTDGK
ncbi:MAG: DMT family transporter [Pigmentiphaga sp.]|uniref:DMT family transporter n=1 Tax=Pigmentiphaga sp. TaxID=1977564 RepID=UPI0029BB651A|nr:DMT family transporter [Pigmentiphaga sp.]MDX3905438.1 DMT family transporter [Pigmentiphaga sp.]